MKKLKKIDIDFLCLEKRTRKELLLKIFYSIAIFIILFLAFYLIYSVNIKKNKYLALKNELENRISLKKEEFIRLGKDLKAYNKRYGVLIKEINNLIDYKAFTIGEYLTYLRNYQGLLITNFYFDPDFKIRIDVKSQDYNILVNFKKYLENKFYCNIREDRKQQNFYFQTIILKVKNEN